MSNYNILFIGEKEKGYFVEEVVQLGDGNVDYIDESNDILTQEADIIIKTGAKKYGAIIYDIEQYHNEGDELAEVIKKIQKNNGSKVILLVPTINENNTVIASCLNRELRNFLPAFDDTTSKKAKLSKYLTDYYEKNINPIEDTLQKMEEKNKVEFNSYKTIGVVGSVHRIGTTTQCIQIIKYLKYKGYQALYISSNNVKYLNFFSRDRDRYVSFPRLIKDMSSSAGAGVYDSDNHIFKIDNVDILMESEYLTEKIKKDYDFLIYDYGAYKDSTFDKTTFLKDNIQFIVGGSFETEISYMLELASDVSYQNAILMFTGVSEDGQDLLRSNFDFSCGNVENINRIHFAKYISESWDFFDIELYDNIFSIDEKEKSEPAKKKMGFSLFRRK